ncbi:hypothetical protein FGL83_05605 [Leuconostoc lactis]|uniref:Uncharacterized protein n=1 Tax=Leuconostoc lactis TaxID=1246 RepID=A0AAP9JAY5_LEULA|nr:hypothetical protein [Leuconostoc lactis]QEA44168.1 hypothetical protein FGL83_05605 [Leuconostoc lactis]
MVIDNSIIFPENIITKTEERPVADYLYSKMSVIEKELARFVLKKIDKLKYNVLSEILAKNKESKFVFCPFDDQGNPLLGIESDGSDRGADIVIVKRMNSQVDKHDVFEARLELRVGAGFSRISKRLYFGLSMATGHNRVYTHFHDKTLNKSTKEANSYADEYADKCGFAMEIIEGNTKLLNQEPIKTYVEEKIDYEEIG